MRALALLLLLSSTAHALDPDKAITQYRHRVWRVEDGLPLSSIWAVQQTSDGYLWLGTANGLVRFDGVRFVRFDKQRVPELSDDFILTLAAEKSGGLWIGTQYGGLHRLRGGKIERIAVVDGAISWMQEARDGSLWITLLDRGALHYRDGKFTSYTTKEGLASNRVTTIWEARDGSVYFGTSRGLCRLADGKFTVFTSKDGLGVDYANAAGESHAGELWVGTIGTGWNVRRGDRFVRYGAKEGFLDDTIVGGMQDRDDNLWSGMAGSGIARIPRAIPKPLRWGDRIPATEAYVIFEDREGSVWAGLIGDGLHRFSESRFTPFGVPEGMPVEAVSGVTVTRDGAVWAATFGGGIARLDGDRFIALGGGNVVNTLHERDGRLLIGVHGAPVRERIGDRFVAADTHGVEIVNAVAFADAPDGALFVGSNSFGVYRVLADRTERITTEDGLPSNVVRALRVLPDGSVLIGTNKGLRRWRNGRLELPGHAVDLPIHSLFLDGKGELWTGTFGHGLWYRSAPLTTRDGLCDDTINQIAEDARGDLWLSAGRGICRLRRASLEQRPLDCKLFDTTDGLRSAEQGHPAQPSIARDAQGRMWFATQRGVARIDPASVDQGNPSPPPVLVEELRADGKAIAPGSEVGPTRAFEIQFTAPSFTAPERVRFRYRLEGFDRDWVQAESRRVAYYTNLPPGGYRFVVSASNEDGVWNPGGAAISFRLLPKIHQTKWFLSLCALAIGLAAFGVYRGRVAQLRARARELERIVDERTSELRRTQAQLVQSEKMSALGQLVAGVAHELNNPVNFITTNIDFLEERYQQLLRLAADPRVADKAKEIDLEFLQQDSPDLLRAFRHGAERIAAIADNLRKFSLVGESTVKPTDLAEGVRATLRMLEPMLREGVRVELALESLPKVECNPSLINQVFMNLLVNAAQAMKGRGEIRVSGRSDGDFVEIDVQDSGPGVPRELREKIFEPFFTTKDPGQGTGLGLSISYQIVSEHGGTLAVADSERGALFRLRLPLRRVAV